MLDKYLKLTLFILLSPLITIAQKVTLSGYITDSINGETLMASTVYIKELSTGVQTNNYGFYSITIPQGQYTVIYSYVGYASQQKNINATTDKRIDIALKSNNTIKEIEVTTARKDEHVKNTEMGTIKLSMSQIKKLPVVFGEVDILKTLQLLPGVQSAGDGNAGFYVRGGGPDQNLVLLDDAVIYNTGHLFGFFSVFNSEAIKDVTLIKGGAPANYGGRLSSVVDVTMKEGNSKEYKLQGGVGNIASKFVFEGPIKKDKGSFMIAARRTYADVLARPFFEALKNNGYYFYDLNAKANYKLGKSDKIFISAYTGLDKFQFESSSGNFKATIPWGNTTASLRWNHLFSDKLFMNSTAVYNKYHFSSSFDQSAGSGQGSAIGIRFASGIEDIGIKNDFDYYINTKNHIKFGSNYTYHTFTPSQISGQADTIRLNPPNSMVKYGHEIALYAMDDIDISNKLKLTLGLRYSWFGQVGAYTAYNVDDNGNKLDSTFYGKGKLVKDYGGLEPRVNVRYSLSDNSSVKASVSRTYQYLHLVTNNGSTLPTDVWVPSTYRVKPQEAWQYSAGYFKNFLDDKLETSVEIYYKDMKNQIQYKDGYTPNTLEDPELSYVFGRGMAYGAEFFINKTQGRFTGWIGYTLSWTYQKFAKLNNGDPFPAKYDRRHDISVVASYDLNKKWTFSSVFIYGTGNAVTLPTAYYLVDNTIVQQFSKVNAYRTPAYHRLDVSATYTPQHKKPRRWEHSWTFSLYNVYNRANPYFLYNSIEGTTTSGIQSKIYMVYILPIIPSVSYNFKFK